MRIADWPVGNLLDDPWLALLYKKGKQHSQVPQLLAGHR